MSASRDESPSFTSPVLLALRYILDYLRDADSVLRLYIEGLEMISVGGKFDSPTGTGRFVELLDEESSWRQYLRQMKVKATEAQADLDRGTPLLIAHTVVGAWGAFEAGMIEFLVEWLKITPKALETEAFAKVRIPLAEFERLTREERLHRLIDEWEQSLKSNHKQLIDRINAMLEGVGLGGAMDKEMRRTLVEMYQVRNLIVHRGARVDRAFNAACPWLGYPLGKRVAVTRADWDRYRAGLYDFMQMHYDRLDKHLDSQQVEPTAESAEAGESTPTTP